MQKSQEIDLGAADVAPCVFIISIFLHPIAVLPEVSPLGVRFSARWCAYHNLCTKSQVFENWAVDMVRKSGASFGLF